LEERCPQLGLNQEGIFPVLAEESVKMEELPSLSLRKGNSSIQVGLTLVRDGKVDAFISAGNTGAIMAASILILGTFSGLKRPPLVVSLPGKERIVLLLDSGANVDCSSEQLLQFALLADAYYKSYFGLHHPRIALLSNGEEPSKGNRLMKETFGLLKNSTLNFVGNLEAKDLLGDKAEIFLSDGFEGNIALKAMEGVAEEIILRLRQGVGQSLRFKMGGILLRPLLNLILRSIDYSEIGGAPLLGVNGLVFICHGRSRAKAITSTIRQAIACLKNNVVKNLMKQWKNQFKEENLNYG
ncbi:MAG: phosphate acyltransferase PlsX, partial [bacterium]